jgi:hypothetical protein
MKKIFIGIVLFITTINNASACDICGCGVGNYNPHLFPYLSKTFVSVGYNYRVFKSHVGDEGAASINTEYYHTVMLTAQFRVSKKMQLTTMLPFQVNRQEGVHGRKALNGLGDALIMANYRLVDKTTSGKKIVRHVITVGGGLKLASGDFRYDHDDEEAVHNPNFQTGTGSVDYLFNAAYSLRIGNLALNTGVTYKVNNANKLEYRFGNRVLGVLQGRYIRELNKISVAPTLGLMIDDMASDKENKLKVEHTGGYNLQGLAGIEVNTRKIAVGVTYFKPLSQNLADNHIVAKPAVNVQLSYTF